MRATQRLISRGFEAYLVGGCVRDLLLDRTPKDYDIATEARPPQVKRVFARNCRIIGRRFKLAHLHFNDNTKILEVSTFRRTPELENPGGEDDLLITRDNEFGNAEEDAMRRDFTVNALFLDPTRNCILDYTNGLPDLRAKLIRTIGDPRVRFREDPVRILRAAKFAGRLGFQIEAGTFAAMCETSGDLVRSAPPRLLEEILRLLRGGHALDSFQLLRDVGALKCLVPVLAEFLAAARHDQRVAFWRLLEALDHAVHHGHVPQNAVLLGILLVCPVLAKAEVNPARSPSSIAEELLGPLSQSLRLPRRDAGCLKRICGVQHRFTQADEAKRFRMAGFVGGPYFDEALELFELRVRSGAEGSAVLARWLDTARGADRHAAVDDVDDERQSPAEATATDDSADGGEADAIATSGLATDASADDAADGLPAATADAEAATDGGEPGEGPGRRRRRRRRRGRGRGREPEFAGAQENPDAPRDVSAADVDLPEGADLPEVADADSPTDAAAPATSELVPGLAGELPSDELAPREAGPADVRDEGMPGEPGRRRRRRRRGRRGRGREEGFAPDRFPASEGPAPHGEATDAEAVPHAAPADGLTHPGPDAPLPEGTEVLDANAEQASAPADAATGAPAEGAVGRSRDDEEFRGRRRGRRGRRGRSRHGEAQDGGHPQAERQPQHGQQPQQQPQRQQQQQQQGQQRQQQQGQHGPQRHGRHDRPKDRGRPDRREGRRHGPPPRDVDVVPRYRDRRGKIEVIEPAALDLSAFDVELDPKRVPTFGSIVEGKGRPKKRTPRVPEDGVDTYRPPPPPGSGTGPSAPPPPPPKEPDTFGDW